MSQFELITDSIKETVDKIFFFNQDLEKLLKAFNENEFDYNRHKTLIQNHLPPTIKASILNVLSDDEFLDIMLKDDELMFEVLPYLNKWKLVTLLTSVVSSIIIPQLLRANSFLIENDLIDPVYILANQIDPFNIKSIDKITLIVDDYEFVIKILEPYLSKSFLASLKTKLNQNKLTHINNSIVQNINNFLFN